jgi:hypothetical protein
MSNSQIMELVAKLTPEDQARWQAGEINVFPGKDYPVVRNAPGQPNAGKLVPGTGVPPAVPSAENGTRGGYKKTNAYKELLQKYLPADIESGKRGSLGWILEQAMTAMEGGDVDKEFICDSCGERNHVTVWKRPDTNAIKLVMETLIGRAAEQKDININSEQIYRLIDERSQVKDLTVFTVDPHEREARDAAAAEWIEGEVLS